MCARMMVMSQADRIASVFGVPSPPALTKSLNIAPTDDLLAVVQRDDTRAYARLRWGLIPFWAKTARDGVRFINGRSETVHQKQPFKSAFGRKRCLIVADGFYEWRREGRARLPFRFGLASGEPMALAGLWGSWRDGEGMRLKSATVLTTSPNALCARVHDRMPVILPRESWECWLDPKADPGEVIELLRPLPANRMRAVAVSTHVNNVRHDDARCLEPGEHTL